MGGRNGEVSAQRGNQAAQTRDPTAHAGIFTLRAVCRRPGTEKLTDGDSRQPLPDEYRCALLLHPEAAVAWYRDDRKYFELENAYDEFAKPVEQRRLPMIRKADPDALTVYQRWQTLND